MIQHLCSAFRFWDYGRNPPLLDTVEHHSEFVCGLDFNLHVPNQVTQLSLVCVSFTRPLHLSVVFYGEEHFRFRFCWSEETLIWKGRRRQIQCLLLFIENMTQLWHNSSSLEIVLLMHKVSSGILWSTVGEKCFLLNHLFLHKLKLLLDVWFSLVIMSFL